MKQKIMQFIVHFLELEPTNLSPIDGELTNIVVIRNKVLLEGMALWNPFVAVF
jgi:hypothetical protein